MEIKLVMGMEKELYERIDRLTEALTAFSGIKMLNFAEKVELKPEMEHETSEKVKTEMKVTENDAVLPQKEESKISDIKYTVDDVIEALQRLAKAKGKSVSKSVITKYGADKVKDLKAEDYDMVIKDAEEMI